MPLVETLIGPLASIIDKLIPDKAARDKAYAGMMEDSSMEGANVPFDGKRMIYGGFSPILSLGRTG